MKLFTLFLFSTAAFSVASYAAESTEPSENTAPSENRWQGETELGFALKEGNTKSNSLLAKIDTRYTHNLWHYNIIAQANSEATNHVTTEEEYNFSAQANRDLNETNYLLTRAAYEKKRFSGFDYETSISFGYGYRVFQSPTGTMDLEIAPGYRNQALDDGEQIEGGILRAALQYHRDLSETASFDQSLSVEAGRKNTDSTLESSLKTAINSALSLKLAFLVEYQETVPEDTKHADQETTISIVYAF